jgi:arsenate reductase-like glutaredoxin family protein
VLEKLREELKESLNEILNAIRTQEIEENLLSREDIINKMSELEQIHTSISNLAKKLLEQERNLRKLPFTSPLNYCFDKIEKCLNEAENSYQNYSTFYGDYQKEENIVSLLTHQDVKDDFLKQLNEINNICNKISKECIEAHSCIQEESRKISKFSGRSSEELSGFIDNFGNNLLPKIVTLSTNVFKFSLQVSNSPLWHGRIENLDLLKALEFKTEIWAQDFITLITGIRNIQGELYTSEVEFEFEPSSDLEEQIQIITLDELFTRYPPFEPIHTKIKGIVGSYLWFVKGKNVQTQPLLNLQELIELDDKNETLKRVSPANLLSPKFKTPVVKMKIFVGKGKKEIPVYIKYGSKKLLSLLMEERYFSRYDHLSEQEINSIIEKLQKQYEEEVKRRKHTKKAYSVNNLGYVWYCIKGRGLSTDPYDFTCPFENDCSVAKALGDKCKYWSGSRRLFPKVYVVPERDMKLSHPQQFTGHSFIKPFFAKNTFVKETYKKAQWYMPSIIQEGQIVEVEFEHPINKNLPRTNIIGFEIPLPLVKGLIEALIDEDATQKPEIPIIQPEEKEDSPKRQITLDKVLLSKFYIYKRTKQGQDTFSFLEQKSTKIISDFKKFVNNVDKDELIDFLVNSLGHTLAHLFLIFISAELEIGQENLLYLYKQDNQRNVLIVAIAENSTWGSLDIITHAINKFQSLDNMIEKFLDTTLSFLENHEKDLENFAQAQAFKGDSKLIAIAEKIKQRYENFLKNELVFDISTFLNQLILSGEDEKIKKELEGTINDIKELHQRLLDAILVSGINTCIDGCTACVMLEKGCTTPLIQNIVLSRNLVTWFLNVIRGETQISVKGKIILPRIFSIAEKSLFAVSPYLDEDGAQLLAETAKRGVKVILLTNKQFAMKYAEILPKDKVDIYTFKKPVHYKYYIIDDKAKVITSQNLSSLGSINTFKFENLTQINIEDIKRQELREELVEPFRVTG